MTALPDRAYLRRHALPAHFLAELGRVVERRDTPPVRPPVMRRPSPSVVRQSDSGKPSSQSG